MRGSRSGRAGGGGTTQDSGRGSHIKAQVLLFLKEVVEDEFAHKVWVQRVINHLCPSELDRGRRVSTGSDGGQVMGGHAALG